MEKNIETTEKRNWFRDLLYVLLLYLLVFALTLAGDGLIGMLVANNLAKLLFPMGPALETALFYLPFIGTWVVIPLYIWKKDRPVLKALGPKASGNNWKYLLMGLLLGGGMNSFCAFAAWLNRDIALSFDSFHPISFLLIFICVFIQSSAEELYCRGFLYQKFLHRSGKPIVAILGNSVFFSAMHLLNDNITVLSVVNLMTIGIFYSLMVYYMDSIWCCMAHHAAWNFTQNILLGLPNSGKLVPYSVFKLDAASATSSVAYDVGFGIEGSVLATLLTVVGCVLLILWGRKHGRKPIDVWASAAES